MNVHTIFLLLATFGLSLCYQGDEDRYELLRRSYQNPTFLMDSAYRYTYPDVSRPDFNKFAHEARKRVKSYRSWRPMFGPVPASPRGSWSALDPDEGNEGHLISREVSEERRPFRWGRR